jgi:hypothetical protein
MSHIGKHTHVIKKGNTVHLKKASQNREQIQGAYTGSRYREHRERAQRESTERERAHRERERAHREHTKSTPREKEHKEHTEIETHTEGIESEHIE